MLGYRITYPFDNIRCPSTGDSQDREIKEKESIAAIFCYHRCHESFEYKCEMSATRIVHPNDSSIGSKN